MDSSPLADMPVNVRHALADNELTGAAEMVAQTLGLTATEKVEAMERVALRMRQDLLTLTAVQYHEAVTKPTETE